MPETDLALLRRFAYSNPTAYDVHHAQLAMQRLLAAHEALLTDYAALRAEHDELDNKEPTL